MAQPARDEFHHLVDELPDEDVAPLLALVRATMAGKGAEPPRRRRLSFAGLIEAEPDLAARSEEILRDELGRSPS